MARPVQPRDDRPTWAEYSAAFRTAAFDQRGIDVGYVEGWLAYAEPIFRVGLPVIYDVEHLCRLVGYDEEYLLGAAYCQDRFYRTFLVPKRAGGSRRIEEPLPSLKEIQRWILDNIVALIPISEYAKGFVTGRSIKDNARYHRRQAVIVSLDIQDFFPTISRLRVYRFLRSIRYSRTVAQLLARLCTKDDCLPQGAPTSPALSNIMMKRVDRRLAGFANTIRARYTRYADDITISGDLHPGAVIRFVSRTLEEDGFTINREKTRVMNPHQRQEVTGVVVNSHLQAPRDVRRAAYQAVYYIRRYGLASHLERTGERRGKYLLHLLGILTHIQFLNPDTSGLAEAIDVLHKMTAATGEE